MRFPFISDRDGGVTLSLAELFFYDLFLLSLLILAARLATSLHEVIGHALTAAFFGGQIHGVRISLFGGGTASYDLGESAATAVRFLVSFGGIIINILSGVLAFFYVPRLRERPVWAIFLLLFAMVSLLGATAYTTLGFYYEQGDPVAWMKGRPVQSGIFWIPLLIISPFLSYFSVKGYALYHERLCPVGTFKGRLLVTGLTLGLTVCLYIGLYALTQQRSTAIDSPRLAFEKAKEDIRRIKIARRYQELKKAFPTLPEKDLKEMVEKTPVEVKPEEVPRKFPLKPVIAILYFGGALLALVGLGNGRGHVSRPIETRAALFCIVMTAALLALLGWTGGWIYYSVS